MSESQNANFTQIILSVVCNIMMGEDFLEDGKFTAGLGLSKVIDRNMPVRFIYSWCNSILSSVLWNNIVLPSFHVIASVR